MREPTNRDLILMHLENVIREDYAEFEPATWFDILAFCSGYYGEVTLDHILAVKILQDRGVIRQ